MQYLCLIYDDEKRWEGSYDPAELKAYEAFGEKHRAAIKGGHALKPTSAATSLRQRDGQRLITDGPFAETKEQLSGYYLIEATDWTARWRWPEKSPARITARSRCGRS